MLQKELVVSISSTEYIVTAIEAGADAVCISCKDYIRQDIEFISELNKRLRYVHFKQKKLYLAFDFFAHNEDIQMLNAFLSKLNAHMQELPDAIVVYDPGVFRLVRHLLPEVAIHISHTMNVTNDRVCNIWKELGATRIALAHVLLVDEAIQIAYHNKEISIEAFIYGIPCISFSGRKLLSGFLEECKVSDYTSKYSVMEEQRQDEYYKVLQDERGSYIFDSKARNWLKDIQSLSTAGVNAFCIEGAIYNGKQLQEAILLCKDAICSISQ